MSLRDDDDRRAAAELFAEAVDRPTAERARFLDERLTDRPTLRAEVESLLSADAAAGDFLETPALETDSPRLLAPVTSGDRLGPWEIVRPIGEGGMGAVFLAVRADDEFRQQVAIKVSRPLVSDTLRQRFRAERQILADLDHPHIARLLDGGTTESGLPYLVMDYIEGTTIDVYCDRHDLSQTARIELFETVCSAVQHAHRMLVVHRDLKPSNILIAEDGTPRLLDFGIAKWLRASDADSTLDGLTGDGVLPLTPNYASPEQWRGEPLTTATDVYSLGVLLYRLLTGRLPRSFDRVAPAEIERVLRDDEPTAPRLDRDLDRVLLRALSTEPERRYGTVEAFAEDLRRYRFGLPVRARRQTLAYRVGKLLRRHRVAAAAVLSGVLALTGFSIDRAQQARRLAVERDVSRGEATKAEELSTFLTDLLQQADPWYSGGPEPSVRQVLDRGVREIDRRFTDQDEVRGALLDAMGASYLSLGRYDEASPLLERALRIRRRALAPDDPDLARTLVRVATVHLRRSEYARARAPLAEVITTLRAIENDEHDLLATALDSLSMLHVMVGELEAAEAKAREALQLRRAHRESPLDTTASQVQLAIVLEALGRFDEAGALFDQALTVVLAELGEEHPRATLLRTRLATVQRSTGDLEGAEATLRAVLASRLQIFDEEDPQVSQVKNNLAAVLASRGSLDEAEQLYRAVLVADQKGLGEYHRDLAVVLNNLGRLLRVKGDLAGARQHLGRSLDIVRRSLPPGHPGASYPLIELAMIEIDAGSPRTAEPLLRDALALRLGGLPPTHPLVVEARTRLAACVLQLDRPDEAESLLLDAFAQRGDPGSRRHAEQAAALLMQLYRHRGESERAAAIETRLGELPTPSDDHSRSR